MKKYSKKIMLSSLVAIALLTTGCGGGATDSTDPNYVVSIEYPLENTLTEFPTNADTSIIFNVGEIEPDFAGKIKLFDGSGIQLPVNVSISALQAPEIGQKLNIDFPNLVVNGNYTLTITDLKYRNIMDNGTITYDKTLNKRIDFKTVIDTSVVQDPIDTTVVDVKASAIFPSPDTLITTSYQKISVIFSDEIADAQVFSDHIKITDNTGYEITGTFAKTATNIITFTPSAPYADNATYDVNVLTTLKDKNGVDIVSGITSTVTTSQLTPVYVKTDFNGTSLIDGSLNQETNTGITVSFNREILAAQDLSTKVRLLDPTDTPIAITAQVMGSNILIAPDVVLDYGTLYRYQIDNTILDVNSETIANPVEVSFATKTAPAIVYNTIVNTTPTALSTTNDTSSTIQIVFKDVMNVAQDVSTAITVLDNTSTPIAGTNAFVNSQTLEFTPTSALSGSQTYTVNVNQNVQNENGVGLENPYSFSFNTSDLTAPSLSSFSIANGATNIDPTTQNITIQFNELMSSGSIDTSNVVLTRLVDNANIPVSLTVNSDNIVVNSSAPLSSVENYELKVIPTMCDLAGNDLDNLYTLGFTTSDVIASNITSTSPANGSTAQKSTDISITFDEAIDATSVDTVNFAVSIGGLPVSGSIATSDNKTFTFTPSAPLTASSTVDIALSGIKDVAGNVITNYNYSFNTVEGVAPTVSSVVYGTDNNSNYVYPTNNITINMSENINCSSVNNSSVVLKDNYGNNADYTVSCNGTQIFLSPTGYLLQDTPHELTVMNTITDMNENSMVSSVVNDFRTQKILQADGATISFTKNGGYTYAIGKNDEKQVQNNASATINNYILEGHNFRYYTSGLFTSSGLSYDGKWYIKGRGLEGQMGNGTTTSESNFIEYNTTQTWKQVISFDSSVFALTDTGDVYSHGYNANGTLGNGNTTHQYSPVLVDTGVFAIGRGGYTSFIIKGASEKNGGTVFATGRDNIGGIACRLTGINDIADTKTTFAQINSLSTDFVKVIGAGLAAGIRKNGKVEVWGSYKSDCSSNIFFPTELTGTYKDIATIGNTLILIAQDGTLYGIGSNTAYNKLGADNLTFTPTQIDTSKFSAIAQTNDQIIALKQDGTLIQWGQNNFGTRNDGTADSSLFTLETVLIP